MFNVATLAVLAAVVVLSSAICVAGETLREESDRLLAPESGSQSARVAKLFIPDTYSEFFKVVTSGGGGDPWTSFRQYTDSQKKFIQEEEEFVVVLEATDALVTSELMMSLPLPTSMSPSNVFNTPSNAPSRSIPVTTVNSVATNPPSSTSVLVGARDAAPVSSTSNLVNSAVEPTASPTMTSTKSPTAKPTDSPTMEPTETPTVSPTRTKTKQPTVRPTVIIPTVSPTRLRTYDSSSSTFVIDATTTDAMIQEDSSNNNNNNNGCSLSDDDRATGIYAALDKVVAADVTAALRDLTTPQGRATYWLINQDKDDSGNFVVCPTTDDNDEKWIQRWALAVFYFSTNGDEWFHCSSNPAATDSCGDEEPFFNTNNMTTKQHHRFLTSNVHECQWAGISCSEETLCVTKIEFEENNLVGTIATEIGLLTDLELLGMEQGGLNGTIPSELAMLTKLRFIDMDYNQLSGSLPSELFSMTGLTLLDLDNNELTGSISGIENLQAMEFLQLHGNRFTGTIPEFLGAAASNMGTFTVHRAEFIGTMPESICSLVESGIMTLLIANCFGDFECSCCTECRYV